MRHRLCRIAVILVALLYLAALFLFFVGAFGWFGQERTPLAGVFLVPLGLPWNLWLDGLAETVRPWLAAPDTTPEPRHSRRDLHLAAAFQP
jgi:hypothetical protein